MLDDLDLATRSALAVVLRKFDPSQPRMLHGEHGGEWVKGLIDKLKLGGRRRNGTDLAPGEELLGSDVLSGREGAEVLMAFTRRADGSRTVRIATGIEDKKDWGANNRGGTAVLDERGIGRLRNALDRMGAAEADYKARYKAADTAYGAAKRRERALVHKQYPNLSATDRKTLDRLDDETIPELDDRIASMVRQQADADSELSPASQRRAAELAARVDELERERQTAAAGSRLDEIEREVRALIADHAELHEERETGSPVGYAFLTRRRLNELHNFRRERDAAIRHRAALTADRVPLSPADADALDRARAEAAETFAVLTEDLSEDATVDWYPGQEGFGPLTTAELKKLSAMLAAGMEGEPVPDVSRMIAYDPPHAPAGSPTGGQFTSGGGGSSSSGAKNKRGAAGKSRARKRAQPGSVLAYDPATNQGTGYGSKNGDDRVHMMQQALNRMGMTDAAGKELRDDGKLGPKTTAAMKKLQKAMGMTPNGRVTPAMLDLMKNADSLAALKKTVAAAKGAKKTMPARRSQILRSDVLTYDRSFPLDDIQISRSGDGRTVEAYAAMFDVPYEVRDQHGHYNEVINRAAFNRTLNGAGKNAMCLYNHGMTVHGTPDMMGSVPLGVPLEIKPDGRGLLTVTRYNKGPFADQVLESIRNGDIRAQSFRGQIFRSDPNGKPPKARYGQPLPTVTRHELGLSDYGPTPMPVNDAAEIVAVRSLTDLINDFASLTDDDRWELLRTLDIPTLDGDPGNEELEDLDEEPETEPAEEVTATSDHSEPGAEEPPTLRSEAGHSGRLTDLRRHIRVAMVSRGMR